MVESKECDFVTTSTSKFMWERSGGVGVLVLARLLGSEKFLNFLVQLLVGCWLVMC